MDPLDVPQFHVALRNYGDTDSAQSRALRIPYATLQLHKAGKLPRGILRYACFTDLWEALQRDIVSAGLCPPEHTPTDPQPPT